MSERDTTDVNEVHPRAAQILEAASGIFAEQGFHASSIAQIAQRVGIVDAAIYRHYASKRDLLHAVIRSFYEPLIASAEAGVAGITSPRERVRFLIRRHLRAMNEDRLLCRLVISEARSLDDYYRSDVADLSRRYTALFLDAIADGVAAGEFRDDVSPVVVRDLVYGSIEHLGWAAVSGESDIDVDATTDQVMALVMDGMAARAEDTADTDDVVDARLDRLELLVSRLDPSRVEQGA